MNENRQSYETNASDTTVDGRNPYPPIGYLNHDDAAKHFNVHPRTFRDWLLDGRFEYQGEVSLTSGGARRRIYSIDRLREAKEQMDLKIAARAILPEGYISREETAKILGLTEDTLALWHTNGKLRCGVWVKSPNGKNRKIYPRAEVERLKAELEAIDAARMNPPEGYVDIDGVCAMFGITKAAWHIWKRNGKVPKGIKWRSATQMYVMIYSVEQLQPLVEKLRGEDVVYRKSAGDYHIPEGWMQLKDVSAMLGVNDKTITRWEEEGLITCGKYASGNRVKIYPHAEIERIRNEYGTYSPPYPDPERSGCYRIPLAGHDIQRREAIIDAEDLHLIAGMSFHFSTPEDETHGRVATFNSEGDTRLHQIIMGVTGNSWCVGHRNDDPLDCRRANLVLRTRSEANAHRRKSKTICGEPPSSQYKGVCWDKRREKWVAHIKKDRKSMSLGRYHDEIAAAQAYDEAAQKLFGEHARLNFPHGVDQYLERQAA